MLYGIARFVICLYPSKDFPPPPVAPTVAPPHPLNPLNGRRRRPSTEPRAARVHKWQVEAFWLNLPITQRVESLPTLEQQQGSRSLKKIKIEYFTRDFVDLAMIHACTAAGPE